MLVARLSTSGRPSGAPTVPRNDWAAGGEPIVLVMFATVTGLAFAYYKSRSTKKALRIGLDIAVPLVGLLGPGEASATCLNLESPPERCPSALVISAWPTAELSS